MTTAVRPSVRMADGRDRVVVEVAVHRSGYDPVKRALDIVGSALFIVAFCWLYALVALAVRLSSKGPVIFRQKRVGRGGRTFTCYKFRSMCVDAEERKNQLEALNEVSGPVFKMKEDPRVTPVGRFLRRFSLDELPQFFNVLKGDMSLVGPRPPVPAEVAHYGDYERRRLSVKPGITCLWQVNGRSDIPFDHWMELDHAYIDHMSLWTDLSILLRTVPAVLTGRGAH